jgi:hypothetical protein
MARCSTSRTLASPLPRSDLSLYLSILSRPSIDLSLLSLSFLSRSLSLFLSLSLSLWSNLCFSNQHTITTHQAVFHLYLRCARDGTAAR